jgi:hypothetical protein
MKLMNTGTDADETGTILPGTHSDGDCVPAGIEYPTNIDGTLDYMPLPSAMRNIWLFNNGGERNDVY